MTVGLNKDGRLNSNKDIEGFLETLYSFTNISPCAVSVLRNLYRNKNFLFKNTFKKVNYDISSEQIDYFISPIKHYTVNEKSTPMTGTIFNSFLLYKSKNE